MSSIAGLPQGVSPPLRARWQGEIPQGSQLAITATDTTFAATLSGGAATFVECGGATLAGEIVDYTITVIAGQGTKVARFRSLSSWAPSDGETAGSGFVPTAFSGSREHRGRGIRKGALVVAGFASDAAGAARAAVTVHVELGLRGSGR